MSLAGLLITAIGLVMMPAPGPGTIVVILGLGILASEFASVARFLDRAELKVRAGMEVLKGCYAKFRKRTTRYQPEHLPPPSVP